MPVNSKHPKYKRNENNWSKIRDVVEGEEAVRDDIETYLPRPPGLNNPESTIDTTTKQSSTGQNRYDFYATFAELPEIVGEAISGLQGLVHEKEPEVELPEKMQYLLDKATPDGDSLFELWEHLTREVITAGRLTLLREIDEESDEIRFCPYVAESLTNWNLRSKSEGSEPTLVVFCEEKLIPSDEDSYEYVTVRFYRELAIFDGVYGVRMWKQEEDDDEPVPVEDPETGEQVIFPAFFGQTFDRIPVTVINTTGIGFDYGNIPALSMAKRALAVFRKSADYNRALYIKGDPQAIIFGIGEDQMPDEMGGGSLWVFTNPEASATYLDIEGDGIPLLKGSIDDEYARFHKEQGRLLDSSDTGGAESGEAIRRRQASRQVTLKSLVISAAAGMLQALKDAGRMLALDEATVEEIRFAPHLDFAEPVMSGDELLKLQTSKNQGAPLSEQSLHELQRKGRLTTKTFEEEMEAIAEEGPSLSMFGREDEEGGPPADAAGQ